MQRPGKQPTLQQMLTKVIQEGQPDDLRQVQKAVKRFVTLRKKEVESAEKRLSDFRVQGDLDDRTLEVLTELFSRPYQAALMAATASLSDAERLLNRVSRAVRALD